MKITKSVVKNFESEQEKYGTDVAISNLLWILGSDLLKDLGVKRVTTTYHKKVKVGTLAEVLTNE